MNFPIDWDDAAARAKGKPIYFHLAEAIKDAIAAGRLQPGDLLPGSPMLAKQLRLSRSTVVRAYDDLIAQRYLEGIPGVGTRVAVSMANCAAASLPQQAKSSAQAAGLRDKLSEYGRGLNVTRRVPLTTGYVSELNFGAAPAALLPVPVWRQIILKHCREHDPTNVVHSHIEPLGYQPLRTAIAQFLRRTRGLACQADQVAVFPGSLHAVNLIARLFIDRGDLVVVENPGFPYARDIFNAHGARLLAMPLDEQGLSVAALRNVENCKMVYVTPSHQDPTGVVMSLARRKELLAWAKDRDAIIVEDDYDCEYQYTGKTLPSLQGLDADKRVIYLATFWKVLYPLTSAGYMVLPPDIADLFAKAELLHEGNFALLELYALTDFIAEGHLERQIKRTGDIYSQRRRNLIKQAALHLKGVMHLSTASGGLHAIVRIDSSGGRSLSDWEIAHLANQAGLPLVSTALYYQHSSPGGEFMLPFAILEEAQLSDAIRVFSELLRGAVFP